ncbi:MAG: excinuclease ABC subunit UvrB [Nanoarchaeota archaeon]|nr:excinuclease ABC subunit UvrB [Nanoarchaeota archaeon]
MKFELFSNYKATDAQKSVVEKLKAGFNTDKRQTLLGITGSGKTFVMANLVEKMQRPTLILAHNKTLAAQLYTEIKEFFPKNKVEYFVSYYDYYQPESYLPTSDTYIEKDASVNEQIEKMRLKATASLMSRSDTIIVASISCIYGLGDPKNFSTMSLVLKKADSTSRKELISKLIAIQYQRNDSVLEPGNFRIRGDVIDVIPAYDEEIIRIELQGDTIESISEINHITAEKISTLSELTIFPAKQFVVPDNTIQNAVVQIKDELKNHLPTLDQLEAHRLKKRVEYDLEMIEELGYCSGIENYSRHFDGRKQGQQAYTLLDYFPKNFLFIIDESHQSIPQSNGMYKGDLARKKNLVDYGFRLPSAYDNRPLKFNEFEKYFNQTLFVSATPAEYELNASKQVVELIYRPTGLLDPVVEIRPIEGQIKDLLKEIRTRTKNNERTLITTLTKKMAEDLTQYLAKEDISVRYMHSDIASLDRIELIRQLRAKEIDVLVGINLLREGLDIPEVSLVAILDADKEGFLRDTRSLIQTIGRASRNENGIVILYADKITKSIREAVDLTKKRRARQKAYNKVNKVIPRTIVKSVPKKTREIKGIKHMAKHEVSKKIIEIDAEMKKAAENLEFEKAIELRDVLRELQEEQANE